MNLSLTTKEALELLVFLKKENTFPLIAMQIDATFKQMEVSELLQLQDICPSTYTIEFQVQCKKCGKEFESFAVKYNSPPKKHTAKCPQCKTKHIWNGN